MRPVVGNLVCRSETSVPPSTASKASTMTCPLPSWSLPQAWMFSRPGFGVECSAADVVVERGEVRTRLGADAHVRADDLRVWSGSRYPVYRSSGGAGRNVRSKMVLVMLRS